MLNKSVVIRNTFASMPNDSVFMLTASVFMFNASISMSQ